MTDLFRLIAADAYKWLFITTSHSAFYSNASSTFFVRPLAFIFLLGLEFFYFWGIFYFSAKSGKNFFFLFLMFLAFFAFVHDSFFWERGTKVFFEIKKSVLDLFLSKVFFSLFAAAFVAAVLQLRLLMGRKELGNV